MILKQNTVPTIVSEGLETSAVTISATKAARFQKVLRDYIYTDKILATTRETLCNALDEHRKHKIDRPVEIGIRKVDEQSEFYVRDFARGLSDYDIKNIMFSYLESTKDRSNVENGGFGVGALSPSSYIDTFFVNSHFEGKRTQYAITLDSDEHGNSIGKIINISEEPTDESGIEVIVHIKSGDIYDFRTKIQNLVRFCPSNVVAKIFNDEPFKPEQPVFSFNRGEYVIKVYNFRPVSESNIHYYQGDVCYQNSKLKDIVSECQLRADYSLVVNIPIGKLGLPISRESFETTKYNQRILNEINGYIKALADEDLAKFKALTIDELIKDKDTDYFVGDIFKCEKKKLFPSEIPIISNLQKTLFGENTPDFEKLDGKTIVGIIPNKKAKDMWRDRMMAHSKGQNKQWFIIVDSPHLVEDRLPESIKNYFVFKKVKSKFFGLRELDANEKRTGYIVGEQRNGGTYSIHKDEYTPLELHNHVRSMLKLEEAEDLEEAKLQMEEQIFDSYKTLGLFTISSSSNGSRCPYWWSASQKMRDSMYAIGWMQPDDDKHDKILKELREEEDRRLKEKELIENCYPRFLDCGLVEKRRNLAQSKIRYAKKVKKIFDNIQTENSLRSKITKMYSYNYYAPKLTRHEFRKILKLTNEPVGV